jgi:hypothetical protein
MTSDDLSCRTNVGAAGATVPVVSIASSMGEDMKQLRNLLAMTSDENIPPVILSRLELVEAQWSLLNEETETHHARQAEDHGRASDMSEVWDETWTHPKL